MHQGDHRCRPASLAPSNAPRFRLAFSHLVTVLALLLVNATCVVSARIAELPIDELHRQVWTTREGLPHNTVNSIAQTPDGYLWFATWEGVARFNGHQFRVFERGPETGLPDSGVHSLSLGPDGRLLVAGARGGLSIVDGERWTSLEPAETIITSALQTSDGAIWLATQGAGVTRRIIDESGATVSSNTYLPSASAWEITEDAQRRIWAATSRGLGLWADDELKILDADSGLPDGPVFSVRPFSDGNLLAGTSQGLYIGDGRRFELLDQSLAELAVSTLLVDQHDAIWIGTIDQGLFRFNEDGLTELGTSEGLPNNRVLSLLQDGEDSLWVGTNGGLMRLRSAPFVTHTHLQGLAGNFVRAVLPHSDGSLWIGTSEGLSRLDKDGLQPVLVDGQPFTQSTLSLTEAPDGGVILGTHTRGVKRWQDGRIVERLDRNSGLPSNDIRILATDHLNRLWIGTSEGLVRVDGQGSRTFLPEHGLPGDYIVSLAPARNGHVWVGTALGMARIDGDDNVLPLTFDHLDDARYIYDIRQDRKIDSKLWLASDRGFILHDTDSGESAIVGRTAGLPIDKYFAVVDDHQGGLWLTSNRGIIRVSRDDAIAVARGRADRIDFELYTEGDGMASSQANGGAGPPAAFHDGRVWIATALGLASVDPGYLERYEDTLLPVTIESFETNGTILRHSEQIELPPGTGRIVIRYAGLGYIMPQRIQYRTWLEGFDQGWVDRGGQNMAEYTNLPPGSYRFRVAAAYPYGPWSETDASVEFTIRPLPWQRPGFWALLAAIFILLILALIRLRLRQLELRAIELKAEVDDKTREIKLQADEFERQARIDQLTGLNNRRAFDEWLSEAFERARRSNQTLALSIMDLDRFKQINDLHSHLVGDEIMKAVADVLREHVRAQDQVARWGGEEFTLTFAHSTADNAAAVCERIRAAIEQTDFGHLAPGLRITTSFGVSDNRQADSYDELLRQADHALYRAKSGGRNLVVVYTGDT